MNIGISQYRMFLLVVIVITMLTFIRSTHTANVSVNFQKIGSCNSTITVRVGDYCDFIVTITISANGSTNVSSDLTVEIIMPDNNTVVMQMSKPQITYVGSNFFNSTGLYAPTINMSSQLNSSQFDDAYIDFGTVMNQGLVTPSNDTDSSIDISFRTILISSPGYLTNGSQHWVTVGIEYNNQSEIWIGQGLFIYANGSASGTIGTFTIQSISNASTQTPQGSPFGVAIPIAYAATYANNFVFTITNNNPSQLGLCSAYVQSANNGFMHLPTLGYEISVNLTSVLTSNSITISLGQIVNTQYYNGSAGILNIVVYGRVFKTDSISSYAAGTLTASVSATSTSTALSTFTVYAVAAIIPGPVTGSLPSYTMSLQNSTYGIYQAVVMTITMTVPSNFSAPVTIDLNGSFNMSTPLLKSCAVIFQTAGENVAGSNGQCTDPNTARLTYTSSVNTTNYDQLTFDYGVITNTGFRSTIYSNTVNVITFQAIFQVLNTTQTQALPAISMSLGNNTLWLGNMMIGITTMNYTATNSTAPTFALSYSTNLTNQSTTVLGTLRLFYYDIYTQPGMVYTPMVLSITTNETIPGNQIPAASICLVNIQYVGTNTPCLLTQLYNEPLSPFITYSSRFNAQKNDTALVQLGPLCNSATTQTDPNLGRIRVGVYVKVETALGNGGSTYVNLDIYYEPTNLWVGQVLFTGSQPGTTPSVTGTPLMFPVNATGQQFNINALTIANYGLKIPGGSGGTYSSLNSAITEINAQTAVCRVDISPNRGSNVPCSTDVSSVFTYNTNQISSIATTNLGMICSASANTSTVNSTLSIDADTVIVEVFLLATLQSSSSITVTLSNLIPSGLTALTSVSSTLTNGSIFNFGNVSSINPLNVTHYQQVNDTSNNSIVYLGQDVLIRIQFIAAQNLMTQSCYSLMFLFNLIATMNAAYFTNGFIVSTGDNLMCMKKNLPILSSGGSTLYNASMQLDLGILCYYPIDPTNVTASTMIVQANVRVPVSTTVSVGGQIAVNTVALISNNQSALNSTVTLTVANYTGYMGFTVSSNDSTSMLPAIVNSTIISGIHQMTTYPFKIYLPPYSQGRLQLNVMSIQMANSVTVDITSVNIISAGINVGSFMTEYALGNKYKWTYSTSVNGSSYQDTAHLDLGVVTNTGTSLIQQNYSNTTDNFIYVTASGYLTDSPLAEQNYAFSVVMSATYGQNNVSTSFSAVVTRNGSEAPVMFVNHTDITSGSYGIGSTYSGMIQFGHLNNSTAECINAQLILYLPTWISFQSYNSTVTTTNYTSDNASFVLFNFGTLLFNDNGIVTFTLNIGTSSQMTVVYQRYSSPIITIPYEFLCMKRPRNNTSIYPASKVFAFADMISLSTSIGGSVSNMPTLLGTLNSCQFTSSVTGSNASLVRTSGWQTGYRSNAWMLTGSTYVQINFGNLTFINSIQLSVPGSFAPIRTVQLGYSWDGISFAISSNLYTINGSSMYTFPLTQPILIGYLRVYLIDVVQPNDLLTLTSGFILNITGQINSTNVPVSNVCPISGSNALVPRTILVAPAVQTGLTYYDDVYVCDETTTRTQILCHLLFNGIMSGSATWTALNTTVANIIRFVFDAGQQTQSLYGYGQDGVSILRSDDRGETWSVTDQNEYTNVTAQCAALQKVCTTSDTYPLMNGSPGWLQMQGGAVTWAANVDGLWTQQSSGSLAFDWF